MIRLEQLEIYMLLVASFEDLVRNYDATVVTFDNSIEYFGSFLSCMGEFDVVSRYSHVFSIVFCGQEIMQ